MLVLHCFLLNSKSVGVVKIVDMWEKGYQVYLFDDCTNALGKCFPTHH